MVPLVRLTPFFFILFLSCSHFSRVGYVIEQGVGQLTLQQKARNNSEILKDPGVDPAFKRNIKIIEKEKAFFYRYFGQKEKAIYSRTTLLKSKAVSYLVIAAPYNKIAPQLFSFPFLGDFPYLGFFNEKSADDFRYSIHNSGEAITWKRPVYAYSTLGYFEDTILSSFFELPRSVMMEMIFHELFHSIFFIKNEVELNENLANYFGRELLLLYLNLGPEDLKKWNAQERSGLEIERVVVDLVRGLKEEWDRTPPETPEKAQTELSLFLKKRFYPTISSACTIRHIPLSSCTYLYQEWNQASMAALLTYEAKSENILKLHQRLGVDLKSFYNYLQERHLAYLALNDQRSFSDFLFGE